MIMLVRVLKPLWLTLCSRLNTPHELRKTLNRPAKDVIVNSIEIETCDEMDYKPCTFTFTKKMFSFCFVLSKES